MSRASAIALLFLYLLVNTNLQGIIRLPILFEHFSEHKQKDQSVGFADFIVLHYFSGNARDADHERDQQLPFKGSHCEAMSLPIGMPAESAPTAPSPTADAIEKIVMYASPFISSLAQFTIWQPPWS